MIDAEVTIDVTVTCDQCKTTQSDSEYPDPWGFVRLDTAVEDMLQGFIDDGWEIEDEKALCPDCIEAREEEEEPLDPYRDNGGIPPEVGIGLKLFDE